MPHTDQATGAAAMDGLFKVALKWFKCSWTGQDVCQPHALVESTMTVHTSPLEIPQSKHECHMSEAELPASAGL